MIVLAVETATDGAAVALADEEGVLASSATGRGRRHVETVAPAIVDVCRRAGLALAEVDVLAVDVGPGLFSGLRVGVGTVSALAFALGRPVVAATSLEILAQAVAGSGAGEGRLVAAVVDARRGEVFTSRFRVGRAGAEALSAPATVTPESLAAELFELGEPVVVAGDGGRRHGAVLGAVPGVTVAGPALAAPPVTALAELAAVRARTGALSDGAAIAPCYVRPPDVRINWERRAPAGAAGRSGASR